MHEDGDLGVFYMNEDGDDGGICVVMKNLENLVSGLLWD
jgi:hypothetical protein